MASADKVEAMLAVCLGLTAAEQPQAKDTGESGAHCLQVRTLQQGIEAVVAARNLELSRAARGW